MEGLWVMCGKIKIRRGLFFWLLRYLRFIDYVGFKEFWLLQWWYESPFCNSWLLM